MKLNNKHKQLILLIIVMPLLFFSGCFGYSTYTDKTNLFSISYPNGWANYEPLVETTDKLKGIDVLKALNAPDQIEADTLIFMAGKPHRDSPLPYLVILLFPNKEGFSIEKIVDGYINDVKSISKDFIELSREKAIIAGKEAVIMKSEGTIPIIASSPDSSYRGYLDMFLNANNVTWNVKCLSDFEEYSKWDKDFQHTIRSLKILR
jgi:hypothetical protein